MCPIPTTTPTVLDSRAQAVLDRLHSASRRDWWKFLRRSPLLGWALLRGRTSDSRFEHRFFHDVYIPVSRQQGAMMYLLARATGALRIVEFGTSFGVSTIYLAAAMRDNGRGEVIGSELEPEKHAAATRHLEEAGLAPYARVLRGDALETFRAIEPPVDMVLLDGWKQLYLPVIQLLAPKLRPGAIVFADNIFTFRRQLRRFVEYMQSGRNGFASTTLPVSDGFELSVYLRGRD